MAIVARPVCRYASISCVCVRIVLVYVYFVLCVLDLHYIVMATMSRILCYYCTVSSSAGGGGTTTGITEGIISRAHTIS